MLNLTANMPATKRKYGKTVAKARYGSTSPAAQQRLILSNAKAIRSMQRLQQPSVYCDWQLGGQFSAIGDVGGFFYACCRSCSDSLKSSRAGPKFFVTRLTRFETSLL